MIINYKILITLLIILIVSCNSPLPPKIQKDGEILKIEIKNIDNNWNSFLEKQEQQKNNPNYLTIKNSIKKTDLIDQQKDIIKKVSYINELYNSAISPLLENNREEDKAFLQQLMLSLNRELKLTKKSIKNFKKDYLYILELIDFPEKNFKIVLDSFTKIEDKYQKYLDIINDFSKNYGSNSKKLKKMFKYEVVKKYKDISKKLKKRSTSKKPISIFLLEKNIKNFDILLDENIKKIKYEISIFDKKVTKRLVDSKLDISVQIVRTAKDNKRKFPKEYNLVYPKSTISSKNFLELVKWNNRSSIAILDKGFSTSKKIFIDEKIWRDLNIDFELIWPSKANHAEYWIGDFYISYWHFYKLFDGEKIISSKWVKVDKDTFLKNIKNLDMEIEYKKKYRFSNNFIAIPHPKCLHLVGDKKYGDWIKKDVIKGKKADQIWDFKDGLISDNCSYKNHQYSYSEYKKWKKYQYGKKGYYGPKNMIWYGTDGNVSDESNKDTIFIKNGSYKKHISIINNILSKKNRERGKTKRR